MAQLDFWISVGGFMISKTILVTTDTGMSKDLVFLSQLKGLWHIY